jgi:arsenite methyltransferase
MKIQVFDPPMCCSTGICGPGVDPALVTFSADLDWLKRQGIEVERYNLSQQTQAFVSNATVAAALKKDGNDCLPLILVDGKIASQGFIYQEKNWQNLLI